MIHASQNSPPRNLSCGSARRRIRRQLIASEKFQPHSRRHPVDSGIPLTALNSLTTEPCISSPAASHTNARKRRVVLGVGGGGVSAIPFGRTREAGNEGGKWMLDYVLSNAHKFAVHLHMKRASSSRRCTCRALILNCCVNFVLFFWIKIDMILKKNLFN